jgi:hypothetical protein
MKTSYDPASSIRTSQSCRAETGLWSVAVPVLIAGATFVAFLPALSNRLLAWDDHETITHNAHIRGLTAANLRWMFTHFLMGHYQPLALASLAVDYEIWGMEPFGFHLTNLVLNRKTGQV